MCRNDSLDSLMLQHIEWRGDALIVEEQGGKGDQKGAERYGKSVYANPFQPTICPVLALAVYVFASPLRTGSKQQVYVGTNNKDRFCTNLHSALKKLSEAELAALGCDPKDIGTHSMRKGAPSLALGNVGGPSPVSVFLRMSHSLGKLNDRYIHFGEGADQLLGRVVAGLDFCSVDFSVLPPHFGPAETELLTVEYWREIVDGYDAHYCTCMVISNYIHDLAVSLANLHRTIPVG